MKIRLKCSTAGPDGSFMAGDVADIPDATAQALVANGYAEIVKADRKRKKPAKEAEEEQDQAKKDGNDPPAESRKGKAE